MISIQDHKKALLSDGICKLEGFFRKSELLAARDLIHQIAARKGLKTPTGWQYSETRFALDRSFRDTLKVLSQSEQFPNLINNDLLQIAADLMNEPVMPLAPGQQILFSLPDSDIWSVPSDVWHVDTPRLGPLGLPGLQMFTFLDDVVAEGGGTLVLAGSHKLFDDDRPLRSKELKRLMRQEDYFQWLFDSEREPILNLNETTGTCRDVDLRVVELTGQVGDVYFMDLRALHTPAPNASNRARMMLTCRLPRRAVADSLFD